MSTVIDYKNGQKNNWRRTLWNAISDLTRRPDKALVLYLPGPLDLDPSIARCKGFIDANFIAIERSLSVVSRLRARGRTVIHGELVEVLAAWPEHVKIGVIVADFQCGFGAAARDLARLYSSKACLAGTVLAVNLQRGRDPCEEVQLLKNGGLSAFMEIYEWLGGADRAHRGRLFAIETLCALQSDLEDDVHRMALFNEALQQYVTGIGKPRRMEKTALREMQSTLERMRSDWKAERTRLQASVLKPYRSTSRSPLFDSVVLRYEPFRERAAWREDDEATFRCICAALAIRTRRLRGELPGQRLAC